LVAGTGTAEGCTPNLLLHDEEYENARICASDMSSDVRGQWVVALGSPLGLLVPRLWSATLVIDSSWGCGPYGVL
jgi:hypothetical protein